MRVKRKAAVLAICLCGAVLLSGCSFTEVFDSFVGHTGEKTESSSSQSGSSVQAEVEVKTVDPTLEDIYKNCS